MARRRPTAGEVWEYAREVGAREVRELRGLSEGEEERGA